MSYGNAFKKQKKEGGVGSRPNKKKSHPLNPETIKAVNNFYLSDEVSRIMPGMKDFKSLKKIKEPAGVEFDYHFWLNKMVFSIPKPDCFMLKCLNCPGIKGISERMKLIFQNQGISSITFDHWDSTDR